MSDKGPRLGLQGLAQRRHGALDRPQRHRHPALARQILANHVAVPAMLPKAFRQPDLQPLKSAPSLRLPVRHPAAKIGTFSLRKLVAYTKTLAIPVG